MAIGNFMLDHIECRSNILTTKTAEWQTDKLQSSAEFRATDSTQLNWAEWASVVTQFSPGHMMSTPIPISFRPT